jgi:NADP-dependent 3-hydroxy acid dehydrogenase YdfG
MRGFSSKMHRSFLHDDLADFSKVMSVNLLGVMLGTREAARCMAANNGDSIINVASIGGLQAGGGVMTYRADGTHEDVAEAAIYYAVCTSATGTVLPIDGGASAGGP